ncbi:hypothetical protein B0J13DRAFT_26068 [Dactylonectria estremocensis]|uniref:Uncharacterized protein n=1 Tax=Dactylonectria estremocensis TaxID=1079267 RepID=A0A9P9JEV0_9HYPO|nr:hypothetical protein B0J13DRAFT_26068 [Dactylonectria estremocensis]
MSLARAFTNRKARMGSDLSDNTKSPQRSNSTRNNGFPLMRHKISGPIQLVHTTNMLSYNAPDLPQSAKNNNVSEISGPILRNKASIRSTDSDSPSETTSVAESSPPTSPDVSPVHECPGPEPNHLSTYFMVSDKAQIMAMQADAPAIPRRSPSHTKQNSYDTIARHRSTSRMSKDSDHSVSTKASFTFSRTSSTSTRASSASSLSNNHVQKTAPPPVPPPAARPNFQQRAKESHPFGHELAQVTELAEEYGARRDSKHDDEDNTYIKSKGLVKFSADDYISDVQNLINSFFPEVAHAKPAAPLSGWI